jgi:predicted deacylase
MPDPDGHGPVAKADHPNGPIEIAGTIVAPGERQRFDLPMARLYTHTPLDMPIEVINGERHGPVLLVCAAIHGDELNGVEIIRRLRVLKVLDRLRGALVLAPVVNLFGFLDQSRYLPDRRDLNRCFPGSAAGSLGSRVAHVFFDQVVLQCSHVIDLHTGAVHRDNLPQLRADLSDPVVNDMAHSFGLPVIVNAGLIDGTLRHAAREAGIPVVTYEAGEALRLDERAIVAGVRGITHVMRALGMLPYRRRRAYTSEPYVARSTVWHRADMDGLFRPLVRLGARVRKDQVLGVISAPYDAPEMRVRARIEGIIIGANNMPLVNEGEALFHIARFEPGEEVKAVMDEITAQQEAVERDDLYEIERARDLDLEI